MARTHRLSMTGALIVCLVGTQPNGTLFASDEQAPSSDERSSQTLTTSTSEVPASTSRGFAPTNAVDEDRTAAPDVSVSSTPAVFSRLTFKDEVFAANSPVASIGLSPGTFHFVPTQSNAFAAQVYRGPSRPIRRERNGSIAAIVIGAVASITGAAILVYANRPECRPHPGATGCGYGTKVVGGAVLSGGIVGLAVGALTWR